MADSNFGWIVLINKVPRGPLSEDELRSLLNLGVIRINDVAYKVDPENPKSTSEWRFLWQFNEFDRRKPADGVSAPIERRSQVDETKLRKKISEHIPEGLQSILPEDLIVHARPETPSERQAAQSGEGNHPLEPSSAVSRYATAAVALFLALIGVYGLYTGKTLHDNLTAPVVVPGSAPPTTATQPQKTTIRPPTARTLTAFPRNEVQTPPKIERPKPETVKLPDRKEPDRGEVTEDQVKRLEEERKEADKRLQEEEREDEAEQEPEPKPKKKSVKRAVSSDEELEEAVEENGDEDNID